MNPNKILTLLKEIQEKIDLVGEDLNYHGDDWDRLLSSALSAKDALEEINDMLGGDIIKELMREYRKNYKNFS